ncbi:hypothetical protein QP119_05560 [Corynebacterium frankenforstense]|uniref:hypothetical protein n=1 Tax=Corynebacterium frankenforstense TaxID=1230998 RepID=UPI00254BDA3E|nr:hypothetical protein [Corynebacterium frankenforstense]MDK6259884.1 hypothetical protein [Corynebacterium frankenforstense]
MNIGWGEIALIGLVLLLLAACGVVLVLVLLWSARGYDPRRTGKRRFRENDPAMRDPQLGGIAAWYAGDARPAPGAARPQHPQDGWGHPEPGTADGQDGAGSNR